MTCGWVDVTILCAWCSAWAIPSAFQGQHAGPLHADVDAACDGGGLLRARGADGEGQRARARPPVEEPLERQPSSSAASMASLLSLSPLGCLQCILDLRGRGGGPSHGGPSARRLRRKPQDVDDCAEMARRGGHGDIALIVSCGSPVVLTEARAPPASPPCLSCVSRRARVRSRSRGAFERLGPLPPHRHSTCARALSSNSSITAAAAAVALAAARTTSGTDCSPGRHCGGRGAPRLAEAAAATTARDTMQRQQLHWQQGAAAPTPTYRHFHAAADTGTPDGHHATVAAMTKRMATVSGATTAGHLVIFFPKVLSKYAPNKSKWTSDMRRRLSAVVHTRADLGMLPLCMCSTTSDVSSTLKHLSSQAGLTPSWGSIRYVA